MAAYLDSCTNADPRNKLFKDYLRFIEQFQPKAFLFENVPGLLSLGNGRVFRQILHEWSGPRK